MGRAGTNMKLTTHKTRLNNMTRQKQINMKTSKIKTDKDTRENKMRESETRNK